jgi:hypothetical protein
MVYRRERYRSPTVGARRRVNRVRDPSGMRGVAEGARRGPDASARRSRGMVSVRPKARRAELNVVLSMTLVFEHLPMTVRLLGFHSSHSQPSSTTEQAAPRRFQEGIDSPQRRIHIDIHRVLPIPRPRGYHSFPSTPRTRPTIDTREKRQRNRAPICTVMIQFKSPRTHKHSEKRDSLRTPYVTISANSTSYVVQGHRFATCRTRFRIAERQCKHVRVVVLGMFHARREAVRDMTDAFPRGRRVSYNRTKCQPTNPPPPELSGAAYTYH